MFITMNKIENSLSWAHATGVWKGHVSVKHSLHTVEFGKQMTVMHNQMFLHQEVFPREQTNGLISTFKPSTHLSGRVAYYRTLLCYLFYKGTS